MSVRNAGKTIREARIKAGLTQEQLSEGVCSVLSLSRIENGSAGVSPVTFQALMAHAGAPCEVYPIFASRTDFDCFYAPFYYAQRMDMVKDECRLTVGGKWFFPSVEYGEIQGELGGEVQVRNAVTVLSAIHILRTELGVRVSAISISLLITN